MVGVGTGVLEVLQEMLDQKLGGVVGGLGGHGRRGFGVAPGHDQGIGVRVGSQLGQADPHIGQFVGGVEVFDVVGQRRLAVRSEEAQIRAVGLGLAEGEVAAVQADQQGQLGHIRGQFGAIGRGVEGEFFLVRPFFGVRCRGRQKQGLDDR